MDSILNYESIVKVLFLFVPILIYYKWVGRKKFKDKFNSIFSDNDEHLKITTNLFILIEIAIWVVIVLAFWDIFLVHQKIKDFGQWGDFFGGILNPILTFLTFIGLMITIILQQIELKESRVEFGKTAEALTKQEKHMEIQTFENTFFKMLELHNNIVENLKFEESVSIPHIDTKIYNSNSREVFKDIFSFIIEKKKEREYSIFTNNVDISLSDIYYQYIQINKNYLLGHYFRNLYQILKFIERNEERFDKDLKRYINILRSQLSSYELMILFFNCLDNVVDNGQFKKLLIKYSFLQHMPIQYIEGLEKIKCILDVGQIIYIDKDDFCQYRDNNKSAFDGSGIISKIDCN